MGPGVVAVYRAPQAREAEAIAGPFFRQWCITCAIMHHHGDDETANHDHPRRSAAGRCRACGKSKSGPDVSGSR